MHYKFRRRVNKLKRQRTEKKMLFLLNVPSHGNMGDQLIAEAETNLFRDFFKQYELEQITSGELWAGKSLFCRCVRPCDIIFITGGGYLGSLWPDEEFRLRYIISNFKENTIIVLPQTIFYDDASSQLCKSAPKVYDNHPNLYVLTRDKQSYDFTRIHLMPNNQNHVFLVPDMALTYKPEYRSEKETTNRVLFVLRQDKEKLSANDEIIGDVKNALEIKGFNIVFDDTQLNHIVPLAKRNDEIRKKINAFSNARLVVTDRLHGMIYAAVSGTPVIALDNLSGKIGNIYNLWLKDNENVFFLDKTKDVRQALEQALNKTHKPFNNAKYLPYFHILKDIVK